MAPSRASRWLAGAGLLLLGFVSACSDDASPIPTVGPPTATPTPSATAIPPRTPVPVATPATSPTPDLGLVLPDLQTTASDDVYINVYASGVRLLHFSTEVHNTGEGPIQVVGAEPEDGSSNEVTTAWQVIERRGAGQLEVNVGRLQMNDEHLHWHLDNFATYELWTRTNDGSLGELLTSSAKVTFCLIDEFALDPEAAAVTEPVFGPRDPYEQGISPGWGETYEAWLPGQMLDVTNVPDGAYALRTVLNPDNLLMESNDTNNVYVMDLIFEGNEVTPANELAEEAPEGEEPGT